MDKEKKKYIFLISIVVIGIVMGIIFANILNTSDKILVKDKITGFFMNIKNNAKIDYFANFKNSLFSNALYVLVIWILGLSIIGLGLNIFILFFKSFTVGFSIGSIINIYLYKGILGSILYVFPHIIINLMLLIILAYYANNISIKIFKLLFLKQDIKFSEVIKKYNKVLLYSLIITLISTIIETFLHPLIIKIFTICLK